MMEFRWEIFKTSRFVVLKKFEKALSANYIKEDLSSLPMWHYKLLSNVLHLEAPLRSRIKKLLMQTLSQSLDLKTILFLPSHLFDITISFEYYLTTGSYTSSKKEFLDIPPTKYIVVYFKLWTFLDFFYVFTWRKINFIDMQIRI